MNLLYPSPYPTQPYTRSPLLSSPSPPPLLSLLPLLLQPTSVGRSPLFVGTNSLYGFCDVTIVCAIMRNFAQKKKKRTRILFYGERLYSATENQAFHLQHYHRR